MALFFVFNIYKGEPNEYKQLFKYTRKKTRTKNR